MTRFIGSPKIEAGENSPGPWAWLFGRSVNLPISGAPVVTSWTPTINVTQTDYDRIRVEFPNLDRLQPDSFTAQNYPGSPPEYLRSDMLHALWKLAGEEDAKTKQLIDQLEQK